MAGALDAALALSVNYANERVQFGKPLAQFQAVQQSLASFATHAAAANSAAAGAAMAIDGGTDPGFAIGAAKLRANIARSEEHTSELQSLMRISYAVFCLKKQMSNSVTR